MSSHVLEHFSHDGYPCGKVLRPQKPPRAHGGFICSRIHYAGEHRCPRGRGCLSSFSNLRGFEAAFSMMSMLTLLQCTFRTSPRWAAEQETLDYLVFSHQILQFQQASLGRPYRSRWYWVKLIYPARIRWSISAHGFGLLLTASSTYRRTWCYGGIIDQQL